MLLPFNLQPSIFMIWALCFRLHSSYSSPYASRFTLRQIISLSGFGILLDSIGTGFEPVFILDLVKTSHSLKLNEFPEVKFIYRKDVSRTTFEKVAVISGGESGYAGFVGEGMLTAAICGDPVKAPPTESILAGIRAVTGSVGCLLVVKNYAGGCENFYSAVKQARDEDYKVKIVVVSDDCALSSAGRKTQRRGLTGTILVHKVAGAAAAAGFSLNDVFREAQKASRVIGTFGVGFHVWSISRPDHLGPGTMELGVGTNGESGSGFGVEPLQPVDSIVSRVLQNILSRDTKYVTVKKGCSVVLMVNGFGSTTEKDLKIVAEKGVSLLEQEHGLVVAREYTGPFRTSLDMPGFSITIMSADESILNRLDAATKAPYWLARVDDLEEKDGSSSLVLPTANNRYEKEFEEIRRIGRGGYGEVVECRNRLDRQMYAIKRVPFSAEETDKVMREVYALSLFNHINVVRYYQAWIEEFDCEFDGFTKSHCLFIQMECCIGSLDDELEGMDAKTAWEYFRQIVEGVHHIHQKKVIHRDLATLNLLLDASKIVKICDFGLAKFEFEGALTFSSAGGLGQFLYRAPEMEVADSIISAKVGIFSLGIILFHLLYRFDSSSQEVSILTAIREEGCIGQYIRGEKTRNLLTIHLAKDPDLRPTTKEIIDHAPWDITEDDQEVMEELSL